MVAAYILHCHKKQCLGKPIWEVVVQYADQTRAVQKEHVIHSYSKGHFFTGH